MSDGAAAGAQRPVAAEKAAPGAQLAHAPLPYEYEPGAHAAAAKEAAERAISNRGRTEPFALSALRNVGILARDVAKAASESYLGTI